MRIFDGFEELKAAVGTEVGVQRLNRGDAGPINKFAGTTCDEQWIHDRTAGYC